jgi:hypothetical protein
MRPAVGRYRAEAIAAALAAVGEPTTELQHAAE